MLKHKINKWEQAEEFFETCMSTLPNRVREITKPVLQDPRFWTTPGAIKYHHNWTGGLVVHTAQVLDFALSLGINIPNFDVEKVFVATIYHDVGKIFDYKCRDAKPTENSRWEYTGHQSTIYHLPRSYAEFIANNGRRHCYNEEESEFIGNCILGHHFLKEWSSPVEPASLEAWSIFAGDYASSHFIED